MPRMKAAERRELFIEATMRLIVREGLEGTSTRAIAAEADMALSSLHYVFESREQLVAIAVRELVHNIGRAIDPAKVDYTSIRSTITSTFGQVLDSGERDRLAIAAVLECYLYAARQESLRELGRDRWDEEHLFMRYLLELIAVHCRIAFERPVEELASILLILIDGANSTLLKLRDRRVAELGLDAMATVLEASARPLPEDEAPATELIDRIPYEFLFNPLEPTEESTFADPVARPATPPSTTDAATRVPSAAPRT